MEDKTNDQPEGADENTNEDQKLADEAIEILLKMSPEGQEAFYSQLQEQYNAVQGEEKNSPEAEAARKEAMMNSTF